MKTAVIVQPTEASFQVVAGLPLIQRTVLSAQRSGFERIIVVDPEHASDLRAFFARDARTRHVQVLDAPPVIGKGTVTILPADCLLTAGTLQRVTPAPLDSHPLLFKGAGEPVIALCDSATLPESRPGPDGDGVDAWWAELERRQPRTIPLDGEIFARITDGRSVAAAETALCERLRASTEASDGLLAHWIDRRLSLRISRWLVRYTRLSPNQLTLAGTGIGLAGAVVLALGGYWPGVVGTLLFLVATVFDGCDGEVARLTLRESAFGQKLDVVTDNVVHAAVFIGLARGLYRQRPTAAYLWLMAILLGGFACTLGASYFFLVRRSGFARSREAPRSVRGRVRQRLLRGFEALMNRDFAYLLVMLALVGHLEWFVWGAAFGTYLFVIGLVWVYRWRDAA